MIVIDGDDPSPLLVEMLQFLYEITNHIDITFLIYVSLISVLLIVSGLVSGSEVALFKLSTDELDDFKDSTLNKEQIIFRVLERPKTLLATVLIINNLINIAIVILSTSLLTYLFGKEASEGILLSILTLLNTFIIVIIGEFLPKDFAYHNPIKFSKLTIYPISFFIKLFKPFSYILMRFTNVIEGKIDKKNTAIIKEEDLEHVVNVTIDEDTPIHQRSILEGIVGMSSIPVKQIMRSRLDISALEYQTNFSALIKKIREYGYSRIPVYKESMDKIEGILYAKDLLQHIDESNDFKWQDKIKDAYYIPENKKIDGLLREFQDKRVHMAIVTNEYGGITGLVTLEDILEEIVGEIHDEFDVPEAPNYVKKSDNLYTFEAKSSLVDFCKIVDYEIEEFEEVKGDNETIAGLILELNKKMPKKKDEIVFKNLKFTILEANSRVIKTVKIEIL